jgi:molybdenum cofactor cytidylyltransferase
MRLVDALRLAEIPVKPVVALTGAGGKTALLFRLGAELAAAGKQTLLTATTRLWARQIDHAPFSLIGADPHLLALELPISLRGYRQVLVMAGEAPEPGKLRGLAPDAVCRLAALEDVDAAVVEADGSRERPLKAPAAHEPAIPSCATHVVTVAGMQAINQPLDERWVHRPGIAAELTGLRLGDLVTPEAAAKLLLHQFGGLKGHPPRAESFLYLNLACDDAAAERSSRLACARAIASLVLKQSAPYPGYTAVLIGGALAAEPVLEIYSRVVGVVLAAGRSSRLGGDVPKQLLPWGEGNTLVGHAVDTALASQALAQVLVVTGYRGEEVASALVGRAMTIVANPDWPAGQSGGVQAALRALPPHTSAVVFLLADQPDVRAATIDTLVQMHRTTLAPVVAPQYQGNLRGNPVLFDRRTFHQLLALQGDVGGRSVIDRYAAAVALVPIDLPQPQGIDTWDDYRRRRA